jgi:hypothetical protein
MQRQTAISSYRSLLNCSKLAANGYKLIATAPVGMRLLLLRRLEIDTPYIVLRASQAAGADGFIAKVEFSEQLLPHDSFVAPRLMALSRNQSLESSYPA